MSCPNILNVDSVFGEAFRRRPSLPNLHQIMYTGLLSLPMSMNTYNSVFSPRLPWTRERWMRPRQRILRTTTHAGHFLLRTLVVSHLTLENTDSRGLFGIYFVGRVGGKQYSTRAVFEKALRIQSILTLHENRLAPMRPCALFCLCGISTLKRVTPATFRSSLFEYVSRLYG